MNILHVYRTYFPDTQGGLEEAIRQICFNTRDKGIKSRVFTLSKNAEPEFISFEEADVYRYKQDFEIASCGFSVRALSEFKKHIAWADIVNYHFPWPFADILHFVSKVEKPVVITYHSDIVRQQGLLKFYQPLMRRFLDSADFIVATSANYRQTSPTLLHYLDKTIVIPIGINEISYPKADKKLKEELKSQYGEGFFLFIGVFRYYKGLEYLIKSVMNTDLKLIIAGSGPEEEHLRQIATNLRNNVFFVGQISDEEKDALIELSKAIVLPSIQRSEAFGVTLLEGSMYGKPLISTELGTGTSYINQNGLTGYVIPPKDHLELQRVMIKIKSDDVLAAQLGANSRRWYESQFTGEKMGEQYSLLYSKILA